MGKWEQRTKIREKRTKNGENRTKNKNKNRTETKNYQPDFFDKGRYA
jgi:hypothetical protein